VKAEIVAIGTELLLGDVVNGNAAWLGRELAAVGVDVEQTSAVGDNVARIAEVLSGAVARADVVITTGGLGPTQDDVTREAIAQLLGVPIVRDPDLVAALQQRYADAGRADFPPINLRMAEYPAGARPLRNPAGTAPGLRVEHGSCVVYALPGVPREMREIFTGGVRDELAGRAGAVVASRALHTVGLWESEVAQRLGPLDDELAAAANPTLAYLASEGETLVRITAKAPSPASAQAMITAVERRVRALLGDAVYGADDDTLSAVVHRSLLDAGATVAVAESLTGGLLGGSLSSTPGSSETFRGGVVAYATDVKAGVLGVDEHLLAERGPVDADVAVAMASAVRERLGATFGLATTGVAGPAEQDGVPVGTVHVALVGPQHRPLVATLALRGDRDRIRGASVRAALDLLRKELTRPAGEAAPEQR
jgi:nicotinamide-nucleotide amidase